MNNGGKWIPYDQKRHDFLSLAGLEPRQKTVDCIKWIISIDKKSS